MWPRTDGDERTDDSKSTYDIDTLERRRTISKIESERGQQPTNLDCITALKDQLASPPADLR